MISCIVLAAGLSSRFGSSKPLAKIDDRTVIEFLQEKLLLTGLSDIVFVLGHNALSISPFITRAQHVKYVINENYMLGQTSSFKAGLAAIDPASKGIMLLPIDMPFVGSDTIEELIHIFLKKSCSILVPQYQGRNGHPPIFSTVLKNEFLALKDDEPISTVIHNHEAETVRVAVDDEGTVLSFNTPSEFKDILRKVS